MFFLLYSKKKFCFLKKIFYSLSFTQEKVCSLSLAQEKKKLFVFSPSLKKKKVVCSLSLALIMYKKTNDSTYNNNEKEEEDDKLLKAEKLAIDGLLGIYMVTARAMKDKKL